MPETISQLFGIMPPVTKTFSKVVPLVCSDPLLIYGVELEIESSQGDAWYVSGIHGEADGSLRNAGWEYITAPMTYSNLAFCLNNFFQKAKLKPENYSERCSVHVHANCLDLTVEQLSTVLLLYQTFENILFKYVGEDRDKNIFCVPWSQCTLHYGVVSNNNTLSSIKKWQKYTALNLLPLLTQGSIEFRHMPGTADQKFILQWVNIIGCLFAYARNNSLEETKNILLELNTTSNYRVFLYNVFNKMAPFLLESGMENDIEDGIIQIKYILSVDMFTNSKQLLPKGRPILLRTMPEPEEIDIARQDQILREIDIAPGWDVDNVWPGAGPLPIHRPVPMIDEETL